MTKTINSIRENINEIKKEMNTLNKKYPPTQTGYNSPLSEEIIKILKRIDQAYQNELTNLSVNNYNDCELYKIVYNDFVQFWPCYIQQYNAAASIHGSCAGAMNWQPPYTETKFPYTGLTSKLNYVNKFIEDYKKKEEKKADELAKKQADKLAKKEAEEKKYIEAKKYIEKYNQEQITKQKLEYEKEKKEELAFVKNTIKEKLAKYKGDRV